MWCRDLYFESINYIILTLFIKSAKSIAVANFFVLIGRIAVGTGILYAGLKRTVTYAPNSYGRLVNIAVIGFAFIETFAFMLFGVMSYIMVLQTILI